MSWPAVGWALGQTAPSSPAKFVLVTLGDTASAGDWLAWPSIAYLCATTQQDRKTVMSNLQKLADAKLIKLVGKTGKTGQVAVWKLNVALPGTPPNSAETGTVDDDETVPFFPGNSTVFPSKESQKRDTEPVINQSGTKRKRAERTSLPEVTLRTWLEDIEAKGQDAIPDTDPVFSYADAAGIPADFLRLAWSAFKTKMLASGKRQKDWRATFRVYVREGYLKLWFVDGATGEYRLTTAGQQALRVEAAHG